MARGFDVLAAAAYEATILHPSTLLTAHAYERIEELHGMYWQKVPFLQRVAAELLTDEKDWFRQEVAAFAAARRAA